MAKNEAPRTAITPTRQDDYAEWYQQVVRAADLAENSPVRGCMVIKPWGYAIWENIQRELDRMFKATGHKNAYFPLFIPKSFLEKEAEHVEGFAKECAVVTHHRLDRRARRRPHPRPGRQAGGAARRAAHLGDDHRRVVRQLGAELPRPAAAHQPVGQRRPLGAAHAALPAHHRVPLAGGAHRARHRRGGASRRRCRCSTSTRPSPRSCMAMPVIRGEKTASERFPGAVDTYCIEAMMQDRKALQAGTSHFLGQNFARASGIVFQTKDEKREHAWTTSWGVSTRLIGGLIMTHSDDDGLDPAPAARAGARRHPPRVPRRRDARQGGRVHRLAGDGARARSASAGATSRSRSTAATCAAATRCGSG